MAGAYCSGHGTFTAGCPDCQRLDRAYGRRRRTAVAAGTWQRAVPATIVREHVRELVAAGMTQVSIATAARVGQRTVQEIVGGRRRVVYGPTAAAIMSVAARPTPPAGFVDALPSARMVRALFATGWSMPALAARLGWHAQQLWEVADYKHAVVSVSTDRKIRDLFEELSATPGGSVKARNVAAQRGWLPPLAWDDIDDPNEKPRLDGDGGDLVDEVAIHRALNGDRVRLTPTERHHAIHVAVARGVPATKAGKVLGLSGSTARHYATTPPPRVEVAG